MACTRLTSHENQDAQTHAHRHTHAFSPIHASPTVLPCHIAPRSAAHLNSARSHYLTESAKSFGEAELSLMQYVPSFCPCSETSTSLRSRLAQYQRGTGPAVPNASRCAAVSFCSTASYISSNLGWVLVDGGMVVWECGGANDEVVAWWQAHQCVQTHRVLACHTQKGTDACSTAAVPHRRLTVLQRRILKLSMGFCAPNLKL